MLDGHKKELGEPPIEPPEHDRRLMGRIRYLLRIESMVQVGCKFGPDDLPMHVWDELVAMALERQFVDRIVDHRRNRNRQQEHAVSQARKQTGLPPPGGTIFSHSKPFR